MDSAEVTAYARFLETNRDRPLFSDPHAQFFHSPAAAEFCIETVKHIPYFLELLVVRHRIFSDHLKLILEDFPKGGLQVISLGAGYDTSLHNMAQSSGIQAFEVDSPATVKRKALFFEQKYAAKLIGLDLIRELNSLPDLLRSQGFSSQKPNLWLMEGLLYYMPHFEAVSNLFRKLTSISTHQKNVFLFDALVGASKSRDSEGVATALQKLHIQNDPFPLEKWTNMLKDISCTLKTIGNIGYLDHWGRLAAHKDFIQSHFAWACTE